MEPGTFFGCARVQRESSETAPSGQCNREDPWDCGDRHRNGDILNCCWLLLKSDAKKIRMALFLLQGSVSITAHKQVPEDSNSVWNCFRLQPVTTFLLSQASGGPHFSGEVARQHASAQNRGEEVVEENIVNQKQ